MESILMSMWLFQLAIAIGVLLVAIRIRKLHSFFESVVADIESAFDEEEEGVIELDKPAAETWTETMNRLSKQEESGFEGIDQADEMEELVRQAQRAELAMRNLERKENVDASGEPYRMILPNLEFAGDWRETPHYKENPDAE